MNAPADLWSPFQPTRDDPWDLGKVAHLHRRAGFGATWGELQRDVAAGPRTSVDRFLDPPAASADEERLQANLEQGATRAQDPERLKAWWLYRMLWGADPLREKLALFWHSHFATSNRKVDGLALMAGQNHLFRRLALERGVTDSAAEAGPVTAARAGSFAELLTAIIPDPAMLIWLDGGTNRREQPNENFAREFLELFTLGPGHYTESDVRAAARAFTGWLRYDSSRQDGMPDFHFVGERCDDGEKTFLGRTGAWTANDIVRIVLEQPATAEFLCRKLYRFLIAESDDPGPEIIGPLTDSFRTSGYSTRRIVEIILRSRHFYSATARRQRIASPVEFSVSVLRSLEMPRRSVNLLALAAACTSQGQDLFYPANVKGWDGGRQWLNSATLIARGNWANNVVWGNVRLGMCSWIPTDWATRNNISAGKIAASLMDLLLQDSVESDVRATVLRIAADGADDNLRKALQAVVNCPESQLS